ncbi:MAG: thiamine pyrophosphate-binding protein [Alphaproteobacteria bacterium]|nr:thiamine pyrophosphate-binding protein [Alphaproteobacteria bacterium]MBN9499247.1 thiamine pyrophosphate-binding protein [Alphaproteobacteria bacterium]
MSPKPRSGGRVLVDQLLIHGVDMAFCVPGESYLEVLDALHDSRTIRLINARHEAGAANMAEAYGKLTGKPGICMVTRGPGATHASVGVHTAMQDSTPMILLVGQVGRDMMDREAFQEIDYRQMFGSVVKWAAQIDDAARIPEYMARAFHTATSGRPGPVVLALPEDMLTDVVTVRDAEPYRVAKPAPTHSDLLRVQAALAKAQRPLVIIGGPGWQDEAGAAIQAFAEANDLPVAASFRRMDAIAPDSRVYVGDLGTSGPPELIKRAKEADLLLVIGARLGEMTTQGYTVLESPEPKQTLIHIHADPDELGRVYRPDVGIVADANAFALATGALKPLETRPWKAWTQAARADYEKSLVPNPYNGELDMGRAMRELATSRHVESYVVTVDAGNHTGWPMRFLPFKRPARLVGPTSGAMGYSVPAAVAASLVHPDRLVLGMIGDGGFMMSGLEIATAVQYGAAPIILVFDNGIYGTIRMHQEREHPARVVGTDLKSPDFVGLAKSLGAYAEAVTRTEDFMPALERAIAARRTALLALTIDPEIITTRTTMTAIREAALKRQAAQAR